MAGRRGEEVRRGSRLHEHHVQDRRRDLHGPLRGTVLPGVTRRSIIELLKDWGYKVHEERVAIADIMKAADEGKLEEVFGTGTAAVVSPVKELDWEGKVATSAAATSAS